MYQSVEELRMYRRDPERRYPNKDECYDGKSRRKLQEKSDATIFHQQLAETPLSIRISCNGPFVVTRVYKS